MPFTRPQTLDAAIARLADGNRRFVEERQQAPVPSAERVQLASGQTPFATVFGCSDSRVPIETIFDQQPGNLFVTRVAGNIVSDDVLATIEYGITVLKTMLVLVLGHTRCGAVQAAIDHLENGTRFEGHMQLLADGIVPAAEAARGSNGDWWNNAVHANALRNARAVVDRSSIVRRAVVAGEVRVVAGVYDLESGVVEFLE
jgi:carbonic anhydrase